MENIGLVLAGGGAKGAYQIGAMQAIAEFGLLDEIKAYSGASIGSINAAIIAHKNVGMAIDCWNNLATNKLEINGKVHESVSFDNAFHKLQQSLDFDFLKTQEIYCATTRIDNGMTENEAKSHFAMNFLFGLPNEGTSVLYNLKGKSKEEIIQILQASTAIPVIYPAVLMDGKLHFDGGLKNNLPYEILLEKGYKNLIVIRIGEKKEIIGADNVIDVWPSKPLSGTLNFSKEQIMENMMQGYYDTKDAIKAFLGIEQAA